MTPFTNTQIRQLAQRLVDDHGSTLDQDTLIEQIGLLLENVAGCESPSDVAVQNTTNRIRSAYHDLARENRIEYSHQDHRENDE